MFCHACGVQANEGDVFCGACGAGLSAPAPLPPAAAPPSAPGVAWSANPRPERPKRAVSVLLSLLSLAGLATSGAGALMLLRSGQAPEAVASVSPVSAGLVESGASPSGVVSPGTEPSPSLEPASDWLACSNDVLAFDLTYPATWVTTPEAGDDVCTFFGPEAFKLHGPGGLPDAAIRIYTSDTPYARLERDLGGTPTDGLRRWDLEVDGHRAFRILMPVKSGKYGSGLLYAYVIDIGREALVADAFEPFSEDFRATKGVLDQMMESFQFRSGDAG